MLFYPFFFVSVKLFLEGYLDDFVHHFNLTIGLGVRNEREILVDAQPFIEFSHVGILKLLGVV